MVALVAWVEIFFWLEGKPVSYTRLSCQKNEYFVLNIICIHDILCLSGRGKEKIMHVDADNFHIGYLLGRQFAVIEYAQRRAGDEADPIGKQLLDSASRRPQGVFADLFGLYYRCVLKIEERNEGMAARLEGAFDEISASYRSEAGIPGQLSHEEQCFFFLGYRQQRMDLSSAPL